MSHKNILMTGGAGYLGSILCKKLLKKEYNIKIIDKFMYNPPVTIDGDIDYIQDDIRDIGTLYDELQDIDYVIHLAALLGDEACALAPSFAFTTNYYATKALLDICEDVGVKKILFASTCSLYGASKKTGILLNENSPLNPVSIYAETKLKAEEAVQQTTTPYTILRMGTLYGWSPRMRYDLVINRMTADARCKQKISVNGGRQWRPFIHVEDASDIYIRFLENNKTGIYNVCNENYQIKTVAETIQKKLVDVKIIEHKDNTDLRNYMVSNQKLKDALHPFFTYTIESTIEELAKQVYCKDYDDIRYNNAEWIKTKAGLDVT